MSETNYSSSYNRTNFYKQIEKKVFDASLGSNAGSGSSQAQQPVHSKNLEI